MPPAGNGPARKMQGREMVKMPAPDGVESPSGVGRVLVWQQPHPVYLAEIVYRAHKNRATLDRDQEIVFRTAAYMATFLAYDLQRRQFSLARALPPPMKGTPNTPTISIPAWNSATGAGHWKPPKREASGLAWNASRMGESFERPPTPPIRNGIYVAVELPEETGPAWMARGLWGLPGNGIDRDAMRRTLESAAGSRRAVCSRRSPGATRWWRCARHE